MSSLFELSEKATAKALSTRKIVSIRCCGEFMYQKNIYTSMPTEGREFGISLVILGCHTCRRELEVELMLNHSTMEHVWSFLDVRTPYEKRKYTKRKR